MKILIIGCGGIGSFLVRGLYECMEANQIDTFTLIDMADEDMVEVEQTSYQNFTIDDIGENKAEALNKRYGYHAIPKRIVSEKQLKGYGLIILCVDNNPTRKMVVEYCHTKGVQFIDLRSTGRRIFAMPKTMLPQDNLKYIDEADKTEYSCQEQEDLRNGRIQRGNRVIAEIGCQMILNHLRGQANRTQSMLI